MSEQSIKQENSKNEANSNDVKTQSKKQKKQDSDAQTEFKQADLQPAKELIYEKAKDGELTDKEIDEILDEIRGYYKETPLTEKDIQEVKKTMASALDSAVQKKDISLGMRVVAVVASLLWITLIPNIVGVFEKIMQLTPELMSTYTTTTVSLIIALAILLAATIVLSTLTGVFMFFNKRATANRILIACIAVSALNLIVIASLFGIAKEFMIEVLFIILQIILSVYLNPQLSKEREFSRKIRDLDTEERAKQGRLGLAVDRSKGYIELDFFNLFWIFVICSIIGLFAEYAYHILMVWEPGEFKDRAGLLWGPFSPIYGFGALIMTICLNRLYKINPILLFVACTLIGGTFEYFVSLFLEVGFGITAWDYSDKFLNVNGRTCLSFAMMFGTMGFVWIKWALPFTLSLINKVPWKLRYPITFVFAAFMIVNCIMTVQALDCWSQRVAGKEPVSVVEKFYAENFDDEWMTKRFESMSIDPQKSAQSDINSVTNTQSGVSTSTGS